MYVYIYVNVFFKPLMAPYRKLEIMASWFYQHSEEDFLGAAVFTLAAASLQGRSLHEREALRGVSWALGQGQ